LEEMMQERGVEVDHSSLNRWVLKYTPVLDQVFQHGVAEESCGLWSAYAHVARTQSGWREGSVAKFEIPPRLDILPGNTQTAKRR
jgi:hypothetical protein